jgi:hypothetical protein
MSVPKPATVSIDHNILEGIEMETVRAAPLNVGSATRLPKVPIPPAGLK